MDSFAHTPTSSRTWSDPLKWVTSSKTTLRGEYSLTWALPEINGTCGAEEEQRALHLACPNSSNALISRFSAAFYGIPEGSCSSGWKAGSCNSPNASSLLQPLCVGKPSCELVCSQMYCGTPDEPHAAYVGDPCYLHVKTLAVAVMCEPAEEGSLKVGATLPANSDGDMRIPTLGKGRSARITEGGKNVWSDGVFVPGMFDGCV